MQSNDKCSSFHDLNMVPLLYNPFWSLLTVLGVALHLPELKVIPEASRDALGWELPNEVHNGRPLVAGPFSSFSYICAQWIEMKWFTKDENQQYFWKDWIKSEYLWAPLNYSCPWSWRFHIHLGCWFAGDDMNQYEINQLKSYDIVFTFGCPCSRAYQPAWKRVGTI
jgi:hypothetical protein